MTRNITLAVNEDVLRKVRRIAAERHTTVNALVRSHLESLAASDQEQEKQRREALARLKEMSRNSDVRLGKDYRFSREDAYEGRIR